MSLNQLLLPVVYLLTLVMFCWLGKRIPRLNRVITNQIDPVVLSRQSPIDGLRGILATSVFAYHFYITYGFANTGKWISPTIPLLNNMGAVPVSLFFMITGYLFFNKLKQAQTDWIKLYSGRAKRIYPLYLSLAILCAVIFIGQNGVAIDWAGLLLWLGKWLGFNVPPLPHFYAKPLIAGAVWTLIYEWAFYSILPLVAFLWHRQPKLTVKYSLFVLATTAVAIYLFMHSIPQLYLLFILAMIPAYFAPRFKALQQRFTPLMHGLVPLLALGIMIYTKPYSLTQMLCITLLFSVIASGYDFFNALQNKVLIFLGEISYSIYLMHGLVIYLALLVVPSFNFAWPMGVYYVYLPLVFLLTVILSVLTHNYIEKPFYQSKNKRQNHLQSPQKSV